MGQKPKIQYVGQFYVYGSEAAQPEVKQEKKPKTQLPKLKLNLEKLQKIYVDPVALGGLVLACIMLVVLTVGTFRFYDSWVAYNAASQQLSAVKRQNASLEHAYHTGYDPEQVRIAAEAAGMVDAAEAEHRTLYVHVPKPKAEPTFLDDLKWFLSGLFANAKR